MYKNAIFLLSGRISNHFKVLKTLKMHITEKIWLFKILTHFCFKIYIILKHNFKKILYRNIAVKIFWKFFFKWSGFPSIWWYFHPYGKISIHMVRFPSTFLLWCYGKISIHMVRFPSMWYDFYPLFKNHLLTNEKPKIVRHRHIHTYIHTYSFVWWLGVNCYAFFLD